MSILKYSFPLVPPAPRPTVKRSYDNPEFRLDLLSKWRQIPTDEDSALNFQSDDDGAVIVISVDLLDITVDQAQAIAEQCMASRVEAIQSASAKPVQVLQQSIKPHAGGVGLEMSFASDVAGEHVHLYLGYVTPRKILNFSMVCQPGRQQAMALFNATVPGFRPRLP